jgi:type II secretory pathway pseudopilin PulG
MLKFNAAFTLSELLVSVGVLGLITGMMVPSILNNVETASRRAIFKETYQMLSVLTYEAVFVDEEPTSTRLLENIAAKGNVAKLCATNVKTEGCWFEGQIDDNEATEAGMVLLNGANVYGLHTRDLSSQSDALWVDLNGAKPPNKLNEDMIKLNICFIQNCQCSSWAAKGYKGKLGPGTVSPAGSPVETGGESDFFMYLMG